VILWKWLLNDIYGVVNYWMLALGIVRDPISWLGTDHIMLSTIIMSVWQFFPLCSSQHPGPVADDPGGAL